MDTENNSKPAVSFDVFALSKEGYEVHFQLSGEKAYCSAVKLLETMQKDGFVPRPSNTKGYTKSNANSSKPIAEGAGEVCPIHNSTMKQYSNERGNWHAHKLADGAWCNGKAS